MAATDRMVALQAYLECQHGVSLEESATNEKLVDDVRISTAGKVRLVPFHGGRRGSKLL